MNHPPVDAISLESVSDLVHWVERARGQPGAGELALWYRGQGRRVERIRPAFLRVNAAELPPAVRSWHKDVETEGPVPVAEIEFNKEFVRRAASLLPRRDDLVDIYFLAEHHGLPTRLLDWTTNPLAAVFFASATRPESDGEVIVTFPNYGVAGSESPREFAFTRQHPLLRQAIEYLFGEGECPTEPRLFYVLPDLHAPRLIQQGACFTLHMPGAEEIPQSDFLRLCVPAAAKPELRQSLRTLGVSWATLFPDLDHVCREMKTSWGLDPGEEEGK